MTQAIYDGNEGCQQMRPKAKRSSTSICELALAGIAGISRKQRTKTYGEQSSRSLEPLEDRGQVDRQAEMPGTRVKGRYLTDRSAVDCR